TLFKGKYATKVYALIVVVLVIIGSTLKVDLVWNMSDMFNSLMVLPNVIALLALGKVVSNITKDYDEVFRIKQSSK
ncbi:MAG: alanine:cation symporter family protein, partial [Oscillospiraceae bacterium]